jgi:hypothetical protein
MWLVDNAVGSVLAEYGLVQAELSGVDRSTELEGRQFEHKQLLSALHPLAELRPYTVLSGAKLGNASWSRRRR